MKTMNLFKFLPILCLGVLMSCGNKQQDSTTDESKSIKVKTITAKSQKVDEITTYTANIQADVLNQITPAIPGRIEKILVEVGDRVTKGQTLVQMESSNLQQQNTQLANLQKDYDRYNELLKVGGIAQQQVDQIKTQIDVLTAAIKNLEDNTKLKSPINGVITNKNYDDGDVFTQLPILTVQQLNPLEAIIYVSESYYTKVQKGMPATIKLDVYGDELFTGRVQLVYPTIDPVSHTFGVEVAIDNKEGKVTPGMYSRVSLNFGSNDRIVLPDIAVTKQAGSNDRFVYIVKDGIAHYRKVELGQRINEDVVILSGINLDDEVVIAGMTRLIDGTPVEVINE